MSDIAHCPHCGKSLFKKEEIFGDWQVYEFENKTVILHKGNRTAFSNHESVILAVMFFLRGKVASRDMIYNALYWNYPNDGPDSKIIDVFVCKLRDKIRNYSYPLKLETMWGRGYLLRYDDDSGTPQYP